MTRDRMSEPELDATGQPTGHIVMHAVPAWIDPTRPFQAGRPPQWQLHSRAPSGARVYHWSRGGILIVLPSSTWIMAGDLAGERLAAAESDAGHSPQRPAPCGRSRHGAAGGRSDGIPGRVGEREQYLGQ